VRIGDGPELAVTAWGGPWGLDERWWDPSSRRRRARLQVVAADGRAHLLSAEQGRWWVEATYD
jgi:protein ImuB